MKFKPSELQQIIKEEALRLKKRMMLEAEKKSILKKLREIEECEMMEETGAPLSENSVEIKPEVEAAVEKRTNAIVNNLNPDQLDQAQNELSALGIAPGASEEDIKSKIAGMLPVNESMLSEAWDKSKVYNWLIGAGLGKILAGIVTAAIGSLPLEQATNLADFSNGTVAPTPAIIIGLVVAALGVATTIIGAKGKSGISKPINPEDAQRAQRVINQRKLKYGR